MKKHLFMIEEFFKKYNYIIPIVLVIFCMFMAAHYRMAAINLDATDSWAENQIIMNARSQIEKQVAANNPLLPDSSRQRLVEKELATFMNDPNIEQQKEQLSNQYKSYFQDEDGQTYLLAIDPYYYYRFYRNVIERGFPGEYEEDGKSYTNFITAPNKRDVTRRGKEFHVYFSVWIYKFLNVFVKDLSPLSVFFVIPVIFAALAIIPAFLLGKELGGNLAGVIVALYTSLHTTVISRTPAGFSDTDIYNIFFPLLVAYFLVMALRSKTLKNKLIYSFVTAFVLALYSTAWIGWWYLIAFVGFAFSLRLLLDILFNLKHKNDLKKYWNKINESVYMIGTFVVAVCTIFVIFGGSLMFLIRLPLQFIGATNIQNAAKADLFPNVFTTVAELNEGSWGQIVSSIGFGSVNIGQIFLVLVALAFVLLWFSKGTKESRITKIGFFLVWFLATIYATTKGIRFMIMVAVPTGILVGTFFGLGVRKAAELSEKYLEVSRKGVYVTLVVLVVLILIGVKPIAAFVGAGELGYNGILTEAPSVIAKNQVPSMNDAWYGTLTKIKENSNETAIISSWWDFGHQFITIAERGATADGANQNTAQAHWLGKLFLSDDLRETVGILRMLNCDANGAYEKFVSKDYDALEAIEVIDEILLMDKTDAESYLNKKYDKDFVDDLMLSTHCDAPESFLITSEDMGCIVRGNACNGKTGVWSHFGGWDFEKARIWNIVSGNAKSAAISMLVDEFNITQADANSLVKKLTPMNEDQANSWISPWPGYISPMSPCQDQEGVLVCANGAQIDLHGDLTGLISVQGGSIKPNSIVFLNGTGDYNVEHISDSEVSIILRHFNGKYEAMYAAPVIAESAFTRLFYLNNGGEYLSVFDDVTDITGQRIMTWKVNWNSVE